MYKHRYKQQTAWLTAAQIALINRPCQLQVKVKVCDASSKRTIFISLYFTSYTHTQYTHTHSDTHISTDTQRHTHRHTYDGLQMHVYQRLYAFICIRYNSSMTSIAPLL